MSSRLESALLELGRQIEYPATPEFVIPDPAPAKRPSRLRLVAAAAMAVVLVVLAFPGPRQAVADLFSIGSVGFSVVDTLPPAELVRAPGEQMTLAKAQNEVDFDIVTIDSEPDAVFVDRSVAGGVVTLGFGESDGSYRLLITQIGGAMHPQFLKVITPDVVVRVVDVEGEQGFWVADGPHVLLLLDEQGNDVEDTARLAANTLVYTFGDLTIRIEGDMTLEQAMEIASQLG